MDHHDDDYVFIESKSNHPHNTRSLSEMTPKAVLEEPKAPYTSADQYFCSEDNNNDGDPHVQHFGMRAVHWLTSLDGIAATAFLCNIMALSLPVILVPIAVEEADFHPDEGANDYDDNNDVDLMISTEIVAAHVAHISSLAFVGGAVGKFVNGFICQEFGTYPCSRWYLAGLAMFSLAFSVSTNVFTMGLAFAGMEFCASIQYAALAVMLSNYYEDDHIRLGAALTALGLASTIGEVLAKLVGMCLSSVLHWRYVAQIGALVALIGSLVIMRAPGYQAAQEKLNENQDYFHWASVRDPLRSILGSRLFWILAVPYSLVFVACYADRILVPFYNEMTGFPQSICGGLTLSITVGLVHGLISGSETYTNLQELGQKKAFLRNLYVGNFFATACLTALAYYGTTYTSNSMIMAVAVFVLSAVMASTVAFQFFQLPTMIAQRYGNHKAVCISFLDGFGYFFSIPVFATLGEIVPRYGWTSGWGLLSALFALSGTILVSYIGPILDHTELYDDDHVLDPCYYFEWAINVYAVA